MLQQREIEELRTGTWEVDCPNMSLRRSGTDNADVYDGAGYIRRTSEGELLFKLYSKREADLPPLLRSNVVRGQLIPEDQFYELLATDANGRTWKAAHILPDTHGSWGQEGVVVSGRLDDLTQTRKVTRAATGSSVSVKFFQKLKIPCNVTTETRTTVGGELRKKLRSLNVAGFESCGCHFEISSENGLTNLRAYADSCKLPNNLEVRAVAALQFVLAHGLEWAILQTRQKDVETVRIGRARPAASKGQLGRPLNDRTGEFKGDTWKLFDKYLTHILGYEQAEEYHPLSVRVRQVIAASAGSPEAQALTLAVAVEGILGTEFPDLAALSQQEVDDLDKAQHVIDESDVDDTLKDRLKGTLGSWKEPSATGKLLSLINSGVVEEREYDAWKKLRNPFAHGRLPNSENLQELIDLCHTATVLFYKLIFHAIGYDGKYTDYGSLGWPLKDYPAKLGGESGQ